MSERSGICGGLLAGLLALAASGAVAAEIVTPADCSLADANPCLTNAIKRAAIQETDVLVMPGTYSILHPVSLISGVSILGSSKTIIQPSPLNRESFMLFYGERVSDIRIEGVTFDGGGKDFPSEGWLVVLDGTRNVVLDSVTFQHARGPALAVYSTSSAISSGNGLQNSHVVDIGNHWRTSFMTTGRRMGIEFYDLPPLVNQGNFARHNTFEDIGLDAIHLAGQQGFVAEANLFDLNNGQRELLAAGDYPAAFFIETSDGVTLRNNTIHEALGNCIDMPGVTNALIEANMIVGCGQSGIGVFQDYDSPAKLNSAHVVIKDNIILNSAVWPPSCWKAGISIANGRPSDILISDNIITDLRPKGKKTQDYAIEVVNGECGATTEVRGLVVDTGNRLDGNQRARTHGVP